jgi:hypothetical protein
LQQEEAVDLRRENWKATVPSPSLEDRNLKPVDTG